MSLSEKALLLKEDFDGVYNKGYDKGYSWGEEVGYHNGLAKGEEVGYQNGYSMGYSEGNDEGYARGRTTGIEIGNEQGLIWAEDTLIHSKSDKNVVGRYYLFTSCDLSDYTFKKTFKPIGDCQSLFYDYYGSYLPKNMDLSEATKATSLYTWATNLQEIPDYGLPALPMVETYNYCRKCHTIECIRITETLEPPRFTDCVNLVNLAFEGVIGKSISFLSSPLSVASLKNIITHLKNYAGTSSEFSYTVTFKSSAFAELEKEGATSPNGNTWAEYIDDLKWNLVKA